MFFENDFSHILGSISKSNILPGAKRAFDNSVSFRRHIEPGIRHFICDKKFLSDVIIFRFDVVYKSTDKAEANEAKSGIQGQFFERDLQGNLELHPSTKEVEIRSISAPLLETFTGISSTSNF